MRAAAAGLAFLPALAFASACACALAGAAADGTAEEHADEVAGGEVLEVSGEAAAEAARELTVAVAANAAGAVHALASDFEQESGHRVTVTVGSTGKLYAQILHGAPFDLFLAADQERPRLLVEQGLAVEDSRRTYAIGRLVLWSPDSTVAIHADTLRDGSFRRLAIANPELAPYGAAARDALRDLGLWEVLRSKIVMGENVGQSYAMVASGNAEFGFVALSSVLGGPGSHWEVPRRMIEPIRQDAVLLKRAEANPAARAFHGFLESPKARWILESSGFAVNGEIANVEAIPGAHGRPERARTEALRRAGHPRRPRTARQQERP